MSALQPTEEQLVSDATEAIMDGIEKAIEGGAGSDVMLLSMTGTLRGMVEGIGPEAFSHGAREVIADQLVELARSLRPGVR